MDIPTLSKSAALAERVSSKVGFALAPLQASATNVTPAGSSHPSWTWRVPTWPTPGNHPPWFWTV